MSCFAFALPASAAVFGYWIPPEDDFTNKTIYEMNGSYCCLSSNSACDVSFEDGILTLSIKIPYSSYSYSNYFWDVEKEAWVPVTSFNGEILVITRTDNVTFNCDRVIYSTIEGLVKKVDVSNMTSVLEDLSRDPLFKIADYPSITDDYSLDVIQISESVNGELFVYVYNPSDATVEVEASKINMSLQHYEDKNPTYKLYDLTLVSSSGTLDKYVVNGFTVSNDDYRYYNIAGIYTPFNETIHEEAEQDDDVINYVGYPVAKCYSTIKDNNGNVLYDCVSLDYVDVDIKAVGLVRYPNGFKLNGLTKTDSHFVAFNVDNFNVKHIYSATVSYLTQGYHYMFAVGAGPSETYDEAVEHTDDIYDYDEGKLLDGGWFSKEYSWSRILTSDDFQTQLESYDHTLFVYDEAAINESQFVIQFLETDYSTWNTTGVGNGYDSTRVSEVSILRLRFATPQGVYNLGAVSDVVSDDGKPDYEYQTGLYPDDDFGDLEIILGILIFVAGLVALSYVVPFVKTILSGLIDAISFLIQLLVSLLTMPFEFLASIFGGDKPGKKRGKRK